jgi:hypothetical protein
MRLPIERNQRGKSGATEPSKNALLTIGIRGKPLDRAAVIKKCDGVSIVSPKEQFLLYSCPRSVPENVLFREC